jgi:hypothetical protein
MAPWIGTMERAAWGRRDGDGGVQSEDNAPALSYPQPP